MIEHKVLNFRMDLDVDQATPKLDALSTEGWQVVACARTDLFLTVIMTRTRRVQTYAVDNPGEVFRTIYARAKRRLP